MASSIRIDRDVPMTTRDGVVLRAGRSPRTPKSCRPCRPSSTGAARPRISTCRSSRLKGNWSLVDL